MHTARLPARRRRGSLRPARPDPAPAAGDSLADLVRFRTDLLGCFTRRGDALFELTDAMAAAQGPVISPAELSTEPEFRRGHGSAYAALSRGRIDEAALRRLLVGRWPRPGRANR
jgi:hypothetical protein